MFMLSRCGYEDHTGLAVAHQLYTACAVACLPAAALILITAPPEEGLLETGYILVMMVVTMMIVTVMLLILKGFPVVRGPVVIPAVRVSARAPLSRFRYQPSFTGSTVPIIPCGPSRTGEKREQE